MPIVEDSSRIKQLRLLRGKQGGYDTGRHSSSAVAPPESDNTYAPLTDDLH